MNPFHVFLSGVHAVERIVDADSWEMLGALGVAGDPYPHQLKNVARILDAPDIRHLIADEVGLGKTVQALMILNVLRRRDPSLRVAIVAPERICYQWQVELSVRGHQAARIWDENELIDLPAGEGYVHIIKSDMIRVTPAVPSPQEYDMLIVDEPHALTLRQAEFISALCREGRGGSRFRHVLLLTATPRLGNPDWSKAIFGIIEPERTELASQLNSEIGFILQDHAQQCFQRVGSGALAPEAAVWSSSANRRILRQTRAVWPEAAPRRKIRTVISKPNAGEYPRIELANRRLAAEDSNNAGRLDVAPWQQVRQLFWARDTAGKALRHGTFSTFSSETMICGAALSKIPGDSLFEDLCDVLLEIWTKDETRPVIIVAGDTPTVDMLEARLSKMFPALAADELIATMRGRHNTGIIEVVSAVHSGGRVLIMEEWVEAGLNLHHFADDMVFYNLPWQVARVDQLIGRLDRLRPGGFRKSLKRKSVGEISIWRLILEGTPDQRVMEAMDRLGVFSAPMPFLDEELTARIEAMVTSAAAGRAGYLHLVDQLVEELVAGLDQRMNAVGAAGLAHLEPDDLHGLVSSGEKHVHQWLSGLANIGALVSHTLKTDDLERVTLLKYPRIQQNCPYILGSMDHREGGVVRLWRGRLGHPPRKDIVLHGGGVGRRARFFSTGEEMHDDLVRQAMGQAAAKTDSIDLRPIPVRYPADHPAEVHIGSTLAVSCMVWQPTGGLKSPVALVEQQVEWNYRDTQGFRLLNEGLIAGVDADFRWMALRFPSAFKIQMTAIDDSGDERELVGDQVHDILTFSAIPLSGSASTAGIPTCKSAPKVFARHVTELSQQEHNRVSALKRTAAEDLVIRAGCLGEDASLYARVRELNVDRLGGQNVTDTRQRQLLEGQIATERLRMKARRQASEIRVRLMKETIASFPGQSIVTVSRLLMRVVPNI